MSFPQVTVAMRGARMNYAVPRALHKSGHLRAFVTDFYLDHGLARKVVSGLSALPFAPTRARAMLGRFHPELAGATILHDRSSLWRHYRPRLSPDTVATERERHHTISAEMAGIIARALPDAGDAIYAFHGAALESFRLAKERGLATILEQSIAATPIAREILQQETERWGHLFTDAGLPDGSAGPTERILEEWSKADVIVAASRFVRASLEDVGIAAEKIVTFPYGVALPAKPPHPASYDGTRPLRLLFAGSVTLRKGIQYLLEASRMLGRNAVELRVAGNLALRPEVVEQHSDTAAFLGRVLRSEVGALYEWADVFVLPSLFEGSATVTYEALAHGLPCIVTPNTGSLIRDGVEGRIVRCGDIEGLVACLGEYVERPGLLAEHARNAAAARDRVSDERYQNDLVSFFRSLRAPMEKSRLGKSFSGAGT